MIFRLRLIRLTVIALAIRLAVSTTAYAGIDKLVKNVFPQGTMSNVTRSSVVNEQSAGHLMGGSIVVKTPAMDNLQLISMQAPSCKRGGLPCGAQLDLRAGGFSFVKSGEMMSYLKQLMSQAGSYAGIMLIKTACPQCEDIMAYLDQVAQAANAMSIDSCNMMEALAAGPLSKLSAGSKATQQSAMILSGEKKDMSDIQQKSLQEKQDPTAGQEELKDMVGDNFNLVWKGLDKKAPSNGDGRSLKELLMSLSGTIIAKKDENNKRAFVYKKSLLDKNFISSFIGIGGADNKNNEINLYLCNETSKCLEPKVIKSKLKHDDTLKGRIEKLLTSITKKIAANKEELTKEEEELVALSSINIITKIEIDLASFSNPAHAKSSNEFIESLCFDVITNYLGLMLGEVELSVNELKGIQLSDNPAFEKFTAQVREVNNRLGKERVEAMGRYNIISETKNRMRLQQKMFDRGFENFISYQNEF